jgi:hypothetical protein
MDKPRQIPAVVTPCDSRPPSTNPSDVDASGVSLRADGKPARAYKMPFAYNPGPTSVILLKIMATENYSANASRLTRQRQFYLRLKGS